VSLTFGSLFAGIGGFDLGFERAGMVCKWQVEIDDYATRVLAKHWPNVHRERDIRACGKHNLQPVDVICGGFPCQDISYAGHGAGLDGERSGLFFEAIRVVRELRPRFVVLENVAALLTRGLDRVCGTLAEIGYDGEWHCISAAAVGAPHIRDRVFVIAYAEGERRGTRRTRGVAGTCKRQEDAAVLANSDGDGCPWREERNRKTKDRQPTSRRCDPVRFCDDVSDSACQLRNGSGIWTEQTGWPEFANRDWWETEPAVGRVANGVSNRVDRLRGLGNAVVPQVAEWIGRRIMEVAK